MPFISEVSGIGAAQFTGSEYTNPVLIQSYLSSVSQIYNLTTSTNPLGASDVKRIQDELNYLTQLAKNGVSISQDPNNPGVLGSQPNTTYYMTAQMVGLTDTLFQAIAPNGNIGSITLADLNNFRTAGAAATSPTSQLFIAIARLYATLPPLNPAANPLVYSTISTSSIAHAAAQIARIFVTGRVFSTATINESMTRSIQSFTELSYVETANEVINGKLLDLKNALQATQDSLNSLNQLQQTHNLITVNSRTFTFALGSTGVGGNQGGALTLDGYVAKYEKYTSAQLKAALVPQLNTEFLPFSLPSTEYTVQSIPIIPAGTTTFTIDANTQWKFTLTLNNPNKYYAFNTSTNQFQPVATSYSLSGYYVSGIGYPGINPANFTKAQIAKVVGDGYNGVQKFPLLGTLSGMSALKVQLTGQRAQLSALLVQLAAQTPPSVLADPIKRSQALLGQMSTVYGDLVKNLGPNPPANFQISAKTPLLQAQSGIRAWIMDNYQTFSSPDATKAGLIQQNLTAAITAAQSTNDTQKQDVRNSLLVFEEYYKSAATVLNQLTQIISRMAQGIAK